MHRAINTSEKLPGRFVDLVNVVQPQALMDDVHYENAVEMIDRLLDIHDSMPSKILKGERSMTVEHILKLADRFSVRPSCSWPGHCRRARWA